MDEPGETLEPQPPAQREPYQPNHLQDARDAAFGADLTDVENIREAFRTTAVLQDDIVSAINDHITWVNQLVTFALNYNSPRWIIQRFLLMAPDVVEDVSVEAVNAAAQLFWNAMHKPE